MDNTSIVSDKELKENLISKHSTSTSPNAPSPSTTEERFHTEVISLPSKGVLYDKSNPLASGTIEMKYMTAKEEDILTSKNLIQSGVVIDKLLQSLIVSKINYDDLLVGDKNAVLIAGRILAYGKDYEVEVTCPKCGEKSNHVVDLSQFEERPLEEGTYTPNKNEFSFELPSNKRKVTFKCLTSADEKLIEAELKGLKKLSKFSGIDPEMTTRLKYLITSIDGKYDLQYIRSFVDSNELRSIDSLALRKHIGKVIPDIKMEFSFECPACAHEELHMPMPMSANFFWPGV